MGCLMSVNKEINGPMHKKRNGEPLEEVYCIKYLGSQVAADGEYEGDMAHRINGYKAWGALKSVPSNRGLGRNVKCLYMKE